MKWVDTGNGGNMAANGALLGAVALFSTVEIASKNIQSGGAQIDPFILVFVRFFITGIILLASALPARLRDGLCLRPRDHLLFALNGAVGIALGISLFHISILFFRNASSSAVVFSANPVFVAVLAPFVNKERLSVKRICAVIIGGIGVLLFAFESGDVEMNSVLGLVVMLTSALFFGLSTCISRRIISRYGPLVLMGFCALYGSIMVLPLGIYRAGTNVVYELFLAWRGVLYIAVVGTAAAYGLYYYGLANTSAYRASMAFFMKPILALLLAMVLRAERPNIYTIGGTVLILAGMALALAVGPAAKQSVEKA